MRQTEIETGLESQERIRRLVRSLKDVDWRAALAKGQADCNRLKDEIAAASYKGRRSEARE